MDKKVEGFKNQSQKCEHCNEKVKADTILDMETVRSYFICPKCERANVKE